MTRQDKIRLEIWKDVQIADLDSGWNPNQTKPNQSQVIWTQDSSKPKLCKYLQSAICNLHSEYYSLQSAAFKFLHCIYVVDILLSLLLSLCLSHGMALLFFSRLERENPEIQFQRHNPEKKTIQNFK